MKMKMHLKKKRTSRKGRKSKSFSFVDEMMGNGSKFCVRLVVWVYFSWKCFMHCEVEIRENYAAMNVTESFLVRVIPKVVDKKWKNWSA